MDEVEYIKSNKGRIKIIYKGYMYTVHKNKKGGGIRWRCAQRSLNCKGSISTDSSGCPHLNMPHNHLPDYRSIALARNKFEDNLDNRLISDLISLAAQYDSMPLEQRLKTSPEQEPVLQSQPLSPTKLKVTRQSTKPPQPSPKPPTPEPPNEEVCLRWNSHHSNMQTSFPSLLLREQYVDATLVAEGQSLKCHRLILSSCSPYFEEVLSGISPFQHPVLFMKDIPFWVLKSLCDFMYAGEVHIFQNKLEELLAVAENLKIKGLAGKMDSSANEEAKSAEPPKPVKEEKKEDKETKEKKRVSQSFDFAPKQNSRTVRSVYTSKKPEKVVKEPLSKQGILDPLDLLEPVYEEVTKESGPPKLKEVRNLPMKKGKLKKRKFSEEREESPPPMFLSRKGTRSRPNVKIPKYYHTHYERVTESTIVREPHTEPDPLFQLEEIKAEPLDLDDDVIEIEDNVIGFTDVPELTSHDEEIIGNYDSPLVNLSDSNAKARKQEEPTSFKKISLVAQPIIMNVHSVTEKSNTLQIIDVAQLKGSLDKTDDPLGDVEGVKTVEDPLNFVNEPLEKGTDSITITNVQSMAEIEEVAEKNCDIIDGVGEIETETIEVEKNNENCEFDIEKCEDEEEMPEILVNNVAVNEEENENDKASPIPPVESVNEEEGEREVETPPASVPNEKEEGETQTTTENDKTVNEVESEPIETEENPVQLGFHIAKVASEQFSAMDEANHATSEDCASDLGFQITNVVSGPIEDLEGPNEASRDDPGTFSNHLEETRLEVPDKTDDELLLGTALSETGGTLNEDAQFLAESLERLLDK